jgi:uncharacterized protein (UPF0248 family)
MRTNLKSLIDVSLALVPKQLYYARICQQLIQCGMSGFGIATIEEGEQILVLGQEDCGGHRVVKILRESGEVTMVRGQIYPTAFIPIRQ